MNTIFDYMVGNKHFNVKFFPYPQHNEIDYEVYTVEDEYLYTITSTRPELSTSILWRYIKHNDRTYVNYTSED